MAEKQKGGSRWYGRRRNLFLVIGVALAMALPGIVSGTAYISISGNGTVTATAANVASPACVAYGLSTADTSIISGLTASAAMASPVNLGVNVVETGGAGGTGYEYLVAEFTLGCYNIPLGTTEYFAAQVCGVGATPVGPSITVAGVVTVGSCTAPGTLESVVGADWVVMDAMVTAPLGAGVPSTGSCGTNQAGDQGSLAPLESLQGNAPAQKELIYQDAPTIAAGTAPSVATDTETGVLASGTCYLGGLALPYTEQAGGANLGKIVIPAGGYTATGSAAADTSGATVAFSDTCTTGVGSSGTCGGVAASTEDVFFNFNFVFVDTSLLNGLSMCKAASCTWSGGAGGTTGNTIVGTNFFEVAWTANS